MPSKREPTVFNRRRQWTPAERRHLVDWVDAGKRMTWIMCKLDRSKAGIEDELKHIRAGRHEVAPPGTKWEAA